MPQLMGRCIVLPSNWTVSADAYPSGLWFLQVHSFKGGNIYELKIDSVLGDGFVDIAGILE